MSFTKIQIVNKALRLLGAERLTQVQLTADSPEQARIVNDIYDSVLEEVLVSHPWNFAVKKAELTEIGGLITTWTAEGTANVWQAALTTEPADVKFNGNLGTEQSSIAALTADKYWFWESNVLYVYSTSDPDTAYTAPGVDAVINEFGFANTFALPDDYLRVIKLESNTVRFIIEEGRLETNEAEAKIKYIAKITDTTLFSSGFIMLFAQKLAAEMTIPTSNSPALATKAYELYRTKRSEAKAFDAQEGSSQSIDEKSWEDARG